MFRFRNNFGPPVGTYSCRHDTPRICLRQTLGFFGRLAAVSGALFGRGQRISYVTLTFDVILFCPVGISGEGAGAPPRPSTAIDISAFA